MHGAPAVLTVAATVDMNIRPAIRETKALQSLKQTARDRVDEVLGVLAGRNGDERIFTRIYAGRARQEADAADQRRVDGRPLGPLDGRIVSIKDLFDVEGEPTLAGSLMRREAEPAAADALVVQRLRAAGAIIIGKTLMTEFAFTAVGLNPHSAPAGNAVDPARVAGGSSIGAAVSVAEGTSDISIGSDTGGSVRIPAALNGVTGFKPTARRVPLSGAFPLSPSLDSIGPLARNVADCALADAIMAGEPYHPLQPRQLAGVKIGIPVGIPLQALDEIVAGGFARAIALCEHAGAVLVEHSLDDLIEAMAEATAIGSIAGIEASRVHAGWLEKTGLDVDQRVQRPLLRRLGVTERDYVALMQKRRVLAGEMDARLAEFDFLTLPTVPVVAPTHQSVADDAVYREVEGLLLRNTQIANQFDLTAISLPIPDTELPVGLMLMARHGADGRLLAAAAAVEILLSQRGSIGQFHAEKQK